jgi:hypothetical protein
VKPGTRLAWVLLTALALLAVDSAARLADGLGGDLHFEPGRRRSATLTETTRARLASYEEEVRLTYFVTRRAALPAHLTHLEQRVRDVLEAFRAATAEGPQPFRVSVVQPEDHPEWAPSLASAGLAPWRARRVEGDGYRDDELWSSLRIGYGARPAAVLNGLGPERVAELQRLVLAQLDHLRRPRRPRVALSAPAGYDGLRQILGSGAELLEVDLDQEPLLPGDVDLLFWLDPEVAGEAQLSALERLRARGGSVVLAGHGLRSRERWSGEELDVRFTPGSQASRTLLSHFGLVPLEGLLLDPRGAELAGPALSGDEPPTKIAPWWVRATADNQDFRTLTGQPNGALLFATPDAFVPDPLRLGELGLEATLLAGASELAALVPVPPTEQSVDAIFQLEGRSQPNASLCAILRPQDPWSGRLVLVADSTPFGDAYLRHEDYAHLPLLEILLTHLTSDERMVATRIALEGVELLPELSPGRRALLRGLVVLLIPALLVATFLLRGRATRGGAAWRLPSPRALASGLSSIALVLVASALAPSFDVDLTRDGKNRLTPDEAATFEKLLAAPVEIALCFSSPERLPPEFKPFVRETGRACLDLARSFAGVEVTTLEPDDLDAAARAELARAGIAPLSVGTTGAEAARLFRPFAHLRLRSQGREEVLAFPSTRAFGQLRFRLAHALARLARGAPTRLALFAEPPRLSPAEATLEYQRKGLFAPREGDVFSELAALLGEFDFAVQRLDPRQDAIPRDLDALLWMQPRRDVLPMLEQLAGHLHAGGDALVAGQHFRILSRQLAGAGFEPRFWPEPQFLDLELHYLPVLGIELPREVLFDAEHGSLALDTRVDAVAGQPTYTRLETSQPFLVQGTAGAGRGAPPPGEYLLPYASRIVLDEARLAARGLRATTWLRGSERAWSFAWQGGDLAPEVLRGESAGDGSALPRLDAPPLLAALIEGGFPAATLVTTRTPSDPAGRRELLIDEDGEIEERGRLLLFGNAELFKNEALTLADHDHEFLALRAAATLALAPEVAALLRRERGAPPLEAQSEAARLAWRLVVLGAFPLLLLLFGLWRRVVA